MPIPNKTDSPKTPSEEIDVYAEGPCLLSVCAPTSMDRATLLEKVNEERPTGISSNWELCKDPTFADGQANPHTCEENAERTHYLFNC